jgi:hypothetical protein
MGRLLLATITLLLIPYVANAGDQTGGDDNQMSTSVRQVGPEIKVVEKKRKPDFILFRGDQHMQKEELRVAREEQQRERTAEAIEAMQAAQQDDEPPFIKVADQPEEVEPQLKETPKGSTAVVARVGTRVGRHPAAQAVPAPKLASNKMVAKTKFSVHGKNLVKADSRYASKSSKFWVHGKRIAPSKSIAKAKSPLKGKSALAKAALHKKASKKTLALMTHVAPSKKHMVQRAPASIGPAIVVADQ